MSCPVVFVLLFSFWHLATLSGSKTWLQMLNRFRADASSGVLVSLISPINTLNRHPAQTNFPFSQSLGWMWWSCSVEFLLQVVKSSSGPNIPFTSPGRFLCPLQAAVHVLSSSVTWLRCCADLWGCLHCCHLHDFICIEQKRPYHPGVWIPVRTARID